MSASIPQTTFTKLLFKIRQTFRKYDIELLLKTKTIGTLEPNEFYVNAYYDQEADKENECAIEVYVYHNIKPDDTFEHYQTGQFLVQIFDAVTHEFKHRLQSRARSYKPNHNLSTDTESADYLADPDEIDAYSMSIAIELIRNLGKTRSLQYLRRASRLANIRPKGLYASPSLFHYFKTFGSVDHPVIRKLIKKIYLNLESLDTDVIFY
jgi:hypothetical protein